MKSEGSKTALDPVGMDEGKLQNAFSILEREVAEEKIPGAAAVVGRHGGIVGSYAVGQQMTGGSAVSLDTIYDCASLTKVVVTLPLLLKLLEQGQVHLKEPISSYLSQFRKGQKALITIQHLLTHTSGLKPFVNGYFKDWDPKDVKQYIYSRELDYEPGTRVVYSDLGLIILGEMISMILDEPLDQAAKHYLFEPLGMKDSQFNPPANLKKRIAATEFRKDLGRYLWGEVHDERAYALGGVSGHAGLFSTVGDLSRYARMWLNEGEIEGTSVFSPLTIRAALRNYTTALNGNRGLGWTLKEDSFDASGDLFSSHSYGHTGFTGTSIWIDPGSDLFVILLTNRVHFGRDYSVVGLRKVFHNAVAASVRCFNCGQDEKYES